MVTRATPEPKLSQYRSLRHLVDRMEGELRRLELWETASPDRTALSSEEPFSYDTLMFHQWLQWMFIPRMRQILMGHGDLPRESDIFPYALDCLRQFRDDPNELLFLIKTFDELIGHAEDNPPLLQ